MAFSDKVAHILITISSFNRSVLLALGLTGRNSFGFASQHFVLNVIAGADYLPSEDGLV